MPEPESGHCRICDQQTDITPIWTNAQTGGLATWKVHCPRCGEYQVDEMANEALRSRHHHDWALCGAIRELTDQQRERGKMPKPVELDVDNIAQVAKLAPHKFDVEQRARRFLRRIKGRSNYPGRYFTLDRATDFPLCYSGSDTEFNFYRSFLLDLKWITVSASNAWEIALTADGWKAANNVPNVESDDVFVAMAFKPDMWAAYDTAMVPAILAAKYKPVSVGKIEHTGAIDDLIIASIRKARFIVADVTHASNGVYWEAGFATGLGLDVVYCCHDDRKKTDMHFDTQMFNHITWTDHEHLKAALELRIRQAIGEGKYEPPNDTPPT